MNEFELSYNGTPFIINPEAFCMSSTIFSQIYDTTIPSMVITNDYPLDVFRTFLMAVQNLDYTIDEHNVEDLLRLGTEWGVQSLVNEVNKFLTLHSVQNSATILIDNYEKGVPTAELELFCAKDFNNVYASEAFIKMPIVLLRSVLAHVFENRVEWKVDDIKLAIAVKEILKVHGANISEFFEKLDFNQIPSIVFYTLMDSEFFNKENVADQIFEATKKLLASLKSNRIESEKELKNANVLVSSTQNKLENLKVEVQKAAESIDKINDEAATNENYVKAIKERTEQMEKILRDHGERPPPKNKSKGQKSPRDVQKPQNKAPNNQQQKPQKSQKQDNKFAPYYAPQEPTQASAPSQTNENKYAPLRQNQIQQNPQNQNQNHPQQNKAKKNKNQNKKKNQNDSKFAVYRPPSNQQPSTDAKDTQQEQTTETKEQQPNNEAPAPQQEQPNKEEVSSQQNAEVAPPQQEEPHNEVAPPQEKEEVPPQQPNEEVAPQQQDNDAAAPQQDQTTEANETN
ncbi:hypothetical protein TVAG_185420 [Trichomonas vaginalis G3]|uniref:BTB domain-containing protein n=1 Tax=Trichomonas vaginalis (strain ATCC PRA-98 / G3) TaxID=412133 RepID=A2D8I7_TRIV3|nr:hypothetical protein TVAGG3_0392960 [Trichomonas vaginalis G3]EAY23236.1 hypothetical protein TVAG_185420 [Trichomonas vaginalis G3]KAI5534115.1 hypothetical protein TVAGG3_0392960 [Trichomonas vaginalis G3]|eukprot:XP_001584222.1 hypothetical protein [Trichomonas vaginalis G3]